jgi:hypothetical protein
VGKVNVRVHSLGSRRLVRRGEGEVVPFEMHGGRVVPRGVGVSVESLVVVVVDAGREGRS